MKTLIKGFASKYLNMFYVIHIAKKGNFKWTQRGIFHNFCVNLFGLIITFFYFSLNEVLWRIRDLKLLKLTSFEESRFVPKWLRWSTAFCSIVQFDFLGRPLQFWTFVEISNFFNFNFLVWNGQWSPKKSPK